jgi:hypothetical protein
MLKITALTQEGFGIEPTLGQSRLRLKLIGTGDMAAVAPLRDCLTQVHQEVTRLGLEAVDIDIRALYLLNSSCLNALLGFFYNIQTAGPAYPVQIVTDPRLSWQKRALSALVRMAPDVVSICEG